jgi:hypothetical protein
MCADLSFILFSNYSNNDGLLNFGFKYAIMPSRLFFFCHRVTDWKANLTTANEPIDTLRSVRPIPLSLSTLTLTYGCTSLVNTASRIFGPNYSSWSVTETIIALRFWLHLSKINLRPTVDATNHLEFFTHLTSRHGPSGSAGTTTTLDRASKPGDASNGTVSFRYLFQLTVS